MPRHRLPCDAWTTLTLDHDRFHVCTCGDSNRKIVGACCAHRQPTRSRPAPFRLAVGFVFENHALGFEFVADTV